MSNFYSFSFDSSVRTNREIDTVFPFARVKEKEFIVFACSSVIKNFDEACNPWTLK